MVSWTSPTHFLVSIFLFSLRAGDSWRGTLLSDGRSRWTHMCVAVSICVLLWGRPCCLLYTTSASVPWNGLNSGNFHLPIVATINDSCLSQLIDFSFQMVDSNLIPLSIASLLYLWGTLSKTPDRSAKCQDSTQMLFNDVTILMVDITYDSGSVRLYISYWCLSHLSLCKNILW